MRTNSQYKKIQWLILSSLMAGALTACPDAGTGQASFEVTGKSLGSSFVDGTSIQPAEAVVKNTSSIAGMPPQVSFNITSDLEFSSIDSAIYGCDQTSEVLLTCSAKDGAKLEGQAETNLKPVFDLVYKNVDAPTALQARTHLLNLPISINSAVLTNQIVLAASTVTAAASGFDLSIAKTVSKPFIAGGTGEFTLTASLATLPIPIMPPFYVKVQDPPLPAGFTYNYVVTNANNPAWNCVPTFGGGIQCTLKPSWVLANPGLQPPPIKVTVNVASNVPTTTQLNCPWVYPALGDSNMNNNHLGPAPYTTPCTKYTPTKIDLGITKTQSAPLTTPANSFYWSMPGQYTINVHNYSTVPATGPITVTDVLTSLPNGAVLALGPNFTVSAPWTCTPLSFATPPITCTYTGSIPAGGNAPPLVFNFTVKPVDPSLAIAETNCASLSNPNSPVAYNDANNQNNKSCVDSQNMALEGFDLAIKKTHTNTTVSPGGVVNYVLTVTNNGTGDAPGPITITDTLPAAFSSGSALFSPPTAGTCTGFPTIICTSNSSLAAGSNYTINVTATTSANATGNVTNTATVSSYLPVGETTLQNNTSSDTFALTNAQTKSDLAIKKTHENLLNYAPGDVIHYFLTVTNNGPQTVTGAIVTDVLPTPPFVNTPPATVTVSPSGAATCSFTPFPTVTCTANPLLSGASFVVTINAATDSHTAPGTGIKNTATVSSLTNVDPIPANNTSTDSLTLAQGCTGLTGVQVGTNIVYTFNGIFNTAFGTIPANTAFTGTVTYPIQTAVPSQAQYNYSKFTLTVGSSTYSDTGGKLIITDNLSSSIDEFWTFNTTPITGGALGGITLPNYNGFGLLLRGGSMLWGSPYFPGPSLTRPNFTVSAQLTLIEPTPAGTFSHYYDLCAN